MVALLFNAEPATVDTAFTAGNKATVQSAVTAQQLDPVVTNTGVIMARNAASGVTGAPIHGTKSYDCNGAATDLAYLKHVEAGTPTQVKAAVTMYFAAAPSADMTVLVLQGSTGACASVIHRSTGRVSLINANAGTTVWVSNATTGILTYPCTVTFDMDLDVGTGGTGNTGDGVAHLDVYKHSVSTSTPWASTSDNTGTNVNNNYFRTGVITEERFGKQTSAPAYRIIADSFRTDVGMGLQGTIENPTNLPPVVTPPAAVSKLTGDTVALSMPATDPEGATLTHSWVSTSRPSGASAPTFTPSSTSATPTTSALTVAGTYTFTDTVSDGSLSTPGVFTAYVAEASAITLGKAFRGGTSWTGSVSDTNDASSATYAESPLQPASAVLIEDMNPIKSGDVVITIKGLKSPALGAATVVNIDVLMGATDTVITATPRVFNLADTESTFTITLTGPENAAFTNHNVWALRYTAVE